MNTSRSFGGGLTAPSRRLAESARRCNQREGHELGLSADEMAIEARRECPCCGAGLWIGVPSIGAILDTVGRNAASNVPHLDVDLTRRERQLLNVLYRSPYALRHGQLAALVWSDPDRTHDVRSALYRLRRKLRYSGWAVPVPPHGQGVRLVRDVAVLAA